ncbi:lactonase family protein [Planococcus salinus]|uniref:Lactonase family protein n=1 Tax=Planococcus salinus TaxID=1848460 RepID=A0A3M8P735_9BACL|nr:lactonase family protein [Planococcus salinus]RNF39090.1 lactonase family protein [Planococcus salinus]
MTGTYLLTGSYSTAAEEGIKLWKFDGSTGSIDPLAATKGIERPSFLAVHPNGKNFIATSEVGDGELVSYKLDTGSSSISEINRQKSNGDHPAHVCIDETGKWAIAVNYSGGNVNLYPLHTDGSLGELADSVKHEGTGPNKERQDAAHPHSVFQLPGKPLFFVSDLGTDEIYTYELDDKKGKLNLKFVTEAHPGMGPRHLAFHPSENFVYSLGELNSTLAVYTLNAEGELDLTQTVSLLPESYKGENTSAEVCVSSDGRYLYASNRGHDSITAFTIQENGQLETIGFASSGGKGPRHFTVVPETPWMVAANEESDLLTILKISDKGLPCLQGEPVPTTAPVCVKVIAAEWK